MELTEFVLMWIELVIVIKVCPTQPHKPWHKKIVDSFECCCFSLSITPHYQEDRLHRDFGKYR